MTATTSLPLPRPCGQSIPQPPLQGTLALDFPLPSGLSAVPEAPELTLVVGRTESPPTTARPPECPLPTARDWAGRFVQAVVEVIAGDRPVQQLIRWTDERVYGDLSRRVRILGLTTSAASRHRTERSLVRSVHIYQPHPDAAEVAAHVRHGARSRAVAARLEAERGRWTCTALRLG
jgi:Family of unknown function (DUF6459)